MADFLAKPLELSYVRHVPATGADPDKVLVICHGMFSSKNSWERIGKQIADQTRRIVYCLDLRDHGDSPFSDEEHGEFTYQGIVSDLVNFLRTHDIEKAVLMGHSLGGLNLARLATHYPQMLSKLVLVDIPPKTKIDGKGAIGVKLFADFLAEALLILKKEAEQAGKLDLEAARKRLGEMINDKVPSKVSRKEYEENLVLKGDELAWRFNLPGLYKFLSSMEEASDIEPSFDGAVLLVHAAKSMFVTDFDYVRSMMPNTEFNEIADGDHNLHISHPDELLERIVSFVNRTENEKAETSETSDETSD